MKKTYISPITTTVLLHTHGFLCGSITTSGDNVNVTLGGGEGNFGDGDVINSRRGGGFWDDEE